MTAQVARGGSLTAPAKRKQARSRVVRASAFQAEIMPECALSDEREKAAAPACVSPGPVVNGPTRQLGARVDWLEVAFQVESDPEMQCYLVERGEMAERAGQVEFRIGAVVTRLKRSLTSTVLRFDNADLNATYTETASQGWTVVVRPTATFLASHSLADAIKLCRVFGHSFGRVLHERLRRLDLCADFEGFPLQTADLSRVWSKAKTTTFVPEAVDADATSALRIYTNPAQVVTGFTVGAGGVVMARIYAKSIELLLAGREHKREVEERVWGAGGWTGLPVTRCEFQIRSEALAEYGVRDDALDVLESKLDGIWASLTRKFLRLIVPGTATRRCNCELDARWQAVQRVVFYANAMPLQRSRRYRGGASAQQVLGSLLTYAAARGELDPIRQVRPDGEIVPASFTDASAELFLLEAMPAAAIRAAQGVAIEVAEQLIRKHWGRAALDVFAEQVAARRARFASIDDNDVAQAAAVPARKGGVRG